MKPFALLSLTLLGAWVLLLFSLFGMKEALMLTVGLKGIQIEVIRDLLGLIILGIWILAFYIIRNYVSRVLLRTS